MRRIIWSVRRASVFAGCGLALPLLCLAAAAGAQQPAQQEGAAWRFAVAGDSRNCGDVVMPAIAASALRHGSAFYWHLGDFRALYTFDEDMEQDADLRDRSGHKLSKPLSITQYVDLAWDDFLVHQIAPFGNLNVYLGIGNHELVPPKTRADFVAQFADWLDSPTIEKQRLADTAAQRYADHRVKTYFHWSLRGVDFINLDNASPEQFDNEQMAWLRALLQRDTQDGQIKTMVVGMHRALPDSISADHSMNESVVGIVSGREVYRALVDAQNRARKRVYILASHSHFYMGNIFNTPCWRHNGGVLPGWIVGTAGAVRYDLPANASDAKDPRTGVYGYLLATVLPSGEIQFAFEQLSEKNLREASSSLEFSDEFVRWCFKENADHKNRAIPDLLPCQSAK